MTTRKAVAGTIGTTVDLQCCVSFRGQQGGSITHMHAYNFFQILLLQKH